MDICYAPSWGRGRCFPGFPTLPPPLDFEMLCCGAAYLLGIDFSLFQIVNQQSLGYWFHVQQTDKKYNSSLFLEKG